MNTTIVAKFHFRALAAIAAGAILGAAFLPATALAQDGNLPEVPEMTLGDDDAPVTLYEYASYSCPHCKTFHEESFPKLKEEYIDTGKIHFIYREVYFDRYGLWASMLARCSGPEKFFAITELLYQEQDEWSRKGTDEGVRDGLFRVGFLAGMEQDELDECFADGAFAQALVARYQENKELHDVSGTPTFIINDRQYSNMPYDEMKEILDRLIN